MKESEVVLNEVQAEISKLEQEENDLQKDVVDVRHELERIEGIIKSNKLKVKHWKKEVPIQILHCLVLIFKHIIKRWSFGFLVHCYSNS